jgi:hypothetical protein
MAAADVAGPSAETDASTAPQTRSDEVATCQDDIRKDRLDILASLPVQLVYETGPDIFKKASQALVRLCPNVCFVRYTVRPATILITLRQRGYCHLMDRVWPSVRSP